MYQLCDLDHGFIIFAGGGAVGRADCIMNCQRTVVKVQCHEHLRAHLLKSSLQEMWLPFPTLICPLRTKTSLIHKRLGSEETQVWKNWVVALTSLALQLVPYRTEGQAQRKQNSYLHGVVKALRKVAVEVPGAFHWQTGKLC